jgi:heptosyltransferase I
VLKKILIVKTSSMGDVVHALPAVSDIAERFPNLKIDWLVEKSFNAIPGMHFGVSQVIDICWRSWRKNLFKPATWQAMGSLSDQLKSGAYDAVLDFQGLLKSVLWARATQAPVWGYDRKSIREPFAAFFNHHGAPIPKQMQAVERCRRLAAWHFKYEMPTSSARFGLTRALGLSMPISLKQPFAVLVPCASRPQKLWPVHHWIQVGKHLNRLGINVVVMWGSHDEKMRAHEIAEQCEAYVPPFLSVKDAAALLVQAHRLIGLDTGITHLGAALGIDTIGIYCDHEPGLTGVTGAGQVKSYGGKSRPPDVNEILSTLSH